MLIFDPAASLPEDFLEQGLLIPLDKPYGWTSADVVRKLQYHLRKYCGKKSVKVGHGGTLDPLATGVLLICVGAATKKAQSLLDQEKEYIADIRFGLTTPSYDLEKPVDEHYSFEHIRPELLVTALSEMIGTQEQMPPLFSAKMVNGVRSYELARKGEEAELKAHSIEIKEAELLKFLAPASMEGFIPSDFPAADIPSKYPIARVRIRCSKGTYIRSFARDLGMRLDSGAHLTDLRRTRSGNLTSSQIFDIKEVERYFAK